MIYIQNGQRAFSSQQSTFAFTCTASNCSFYYALSDGSQNYQAKTSRLQFPSPHFSGPRCHVHQSGQCQPHHQPSQTGQLRGNCRKLPPFLVPPERERSPARRAEEMRRKASRRADPGTVKCPKVGARRSAAPGLSSQDAPDPPPLPPARSTRSHCRLRPDCCRILSKLRLSPNSLCAFDPAEGRSFSLFSSPPALRPPPLPPLPPPLVPPPPPPPGTCFSAAILPLRRRAGRDRGGETTRVESPAGSDWLTG